MGGNAFWLAILKEGSIENVGILTLRFVGFIYWLQIFCLYNQTRPQHCVSRQCLGQTVYSECALIVTQMSSCGNNESSSGC